VTTWEGFDNEDLSLFERVARSLRRKAHGLMDEEDLYQSCALWALEHKRKYREAKEEDESHAYRLLRSRMTDLIRSERARQGGYETEDEFSYTPKMLRKLVPLAFDPTWMEQGQDYDKEPSRGGETADPANAWVLVADVRAAFPKLRDQDRLLLYRTLVGPGEYSEVCTEIAREAHTTPNRVMTEVRDALRRLSRLLRRD
jgi:DNA-directed RNA polymerase specialized sigma24 family protein